MTIGDEAQWRALVVELGRADWIGDESLATPDGRHARHAELDEGVATWTTARSGDEIVAALRPRGIAVAKVLQAPVMYDDPQLVARGYYQPLDHAKTGVRRYPGWPMRFSFADTHHRRGAPTLGQHNREILKELGVDDDEIARLAEDGVIGDRMQVPG